MFRVVFRTGMLLALAACSSPDEPGAAGDGGGESCTLAETIEWSSTGPILAPPSDDTHTLVAVKDPTVVRFEDRWHVFASTVSTAGAYNMAYTSFADFSEASSASFSHMDQTPGFNTYVAAPQVFFFRPQNKWYLVYQSGPPMFSTNDDVANPAGWTAPAPFYASTPAIVSEYGGGWLDYWVICDADWCHLFFSSNQGRYFKSKTSIDDFPNGFGEPVVVMHNANSGRLFEGSNVYSLAGTTQYLLLIEAFDQTSNSKRYYRSWISDSLEGPWLPWQASGSYPFAGARNVSFEGTPWTNDISHGEAIRAGYDQTLALESCGLRYLYQGADPLADNGGDYNKIPWHIGLLTQSE
jgi:endo-1,4-beta-xylanase